MSINVQQLSNVVTPKALFEHLSKFEWFFSTVVSNISTYEMLVQRRGSDNEISLYVWNYLRQICNIQSTKMWLMEVINYNPETDYTSVEEHHTFVTYTDENNTPHVFDVFMFKSLMAYSNYSQLIADMRQRFINTLNPQKKSKVVVGEVTNANRLKDNMNWNSFNRMQNQGLNIVSGNSMNMYDW